MAASGIPSNSELERWRERRRSPTEEERREAFIARRKVRKKRAKKRAQKQARKVTRQNRK